jgi:hypothetical protein
MSESAEPSVLERAWAVLRPPTETALASFPIDLAFGDHACRVAIDGDGFRHLLVPALGEQLTADSRPSSLSVAIHALSFDNRMARYVDIQCSEPELNAEFDDVIEDVLEDLSRTDRPGAATLTAIGRWRRLFRPQLSQGLGRQAARGLFAELTILRSILEVTPSTPVDIWTGPLRRPHDFEAPRRCLEVKAVGEDSDFVTIHGIDQLDTHDDRDLDLIVLTIVNDPDGMTLTELVEETRQLAQPSATFSNLLTRSGWSQTGTQQDREPLRVQQVVRMEVGATTPKLVPASLLLGELPPDLSDVTYRLSCEAIREHGVVTTLGQIACEAV